MSDVRLAQFSLADLGKATRAATRGVVALNAFLRNMHYQALAMSSLHVQLPIPRPVSRALLLRVETEYGAYFRCRRHCMSPIAIVLTYHSCNVPITHDPS